MSWAQQHTESERFASAAEIAAREGRTGEALNLYRSAADAESKALNDLPTEKQRTLGITATSAVSLWYKARDYASAAHLAHKWLATEFLPSFATHQLTELLQMIWTAQSAASAGVDFAPGHVLVSVRGGDVVYGGAPMDVITAKMEQLRAIFFRSIEMLLDRPLRQSGAPPLDVQELFQPWLIQAQPGSYQFAVRVKEPPQGELFDRGRPSVAKVASTVLSIIDGVAKNPEQLNEIVPDEGYRATFLKLARNVTPTEKSRFSVIEIRDASTPNASAVALDRASRDAINAAIRSSRQRLDVQPPETPETIIGVLRAVHLDQDWLEVAVDGPAGGHEKVRDLGATADDVVGPMVNKRVTVQAVRTTRGLSFRDIELEE